MEVSDLGSIEHFVDLDQENTSVWSPSPETYLDKHRPPTADNDTTTTTTTTTTTDFVRRSGPESRHPTPPHARACRTHISHAGTPLVLTKFKK